MEICFTGADSGEFPGHAGTLGFNRSLPLAKALDPHTILAYRMNGEPLLPSHGAPVRLIVPGWYGVASVKWLTRIAVLDQPFHGFFQNEQYTIQQRTPRGLVQRVVGPMPVKSQIIRPEPDARLPRSTQRIFGAAWAGEEAVASVEISINGGRSWASAQLLKPPAPFCWTLWEYFWVSPKPGPHVLMSRAARSRAGCNRAGMTPCTRGTKFTTPVRCPYMSTIDLPRRWNFRSPPPLSATCTPTPKP